MIHDVKDDPILQVSSQEPSTSSKYGLRGQGVLDTLLIMLESWNLAHKPRIQYHDDPWCQGWPHPPSTQSGTIKILQVWLRGWGVLDTLLFMLESWNLAHKSRITYHDDPWCQEWPHPPSLQSGTINVLQVWLRGRGVLDTLLIMLESWNLAHKSRITYHDDPWCQGWPHPPRLQSGTTNVLQVWLQGQGVLGILLLMLESWNLAQKSRITYHDEPWCQIWNAVGNGLKGLEWRARSALIF